MSILIATPCYGGMVTAWHMQSCLMLARALDLSDVHHDWHLGWNESLVQRARNSMAAMFLQTDFQKLLFIDADMSAKDMPAEVAKLWNMNADVAVGLYPMKMVGCPLGAWRDGKLVKLADCPKEPFEVDFAGTGFMMIDRKVLIKMQEAWPERTHQEGCGKSFLWFHPRQSDCGEWYMSEDYAFCHDWKRLGGRIVADPSIKLIHHGSFAYEAP